MQLQDPLLTNEEILKLTNVCNELCVTINTYEIGGISKLDGYSWEFLLARNNDLKGLISKLGLLPT